MANSLPPMQQPMLDTARGALHLAVIDMAHDGDNWRAWLQTLFLIIPSCCLSGALVDFVLLLIEGQHVVLLCQALDCFSVQNLQQRAHHLVLRLTGY